MKYRSGILGSMVLLAAAAFTTAPATAQPMPSMDAVIDHLDELYRSGSSHAVMTMTVVRERGTRELTIESWSLGEDDALMVIRSPAREAGTATLRTVDGLWNYAPRADRLIRIPTGLLSESWMGSHFTNDDLMRETSYDDDYDTDLSWADRDGSRHLLVTLTPRPDAPVVYTRVLFWLTPEDWIPVAEEFYDEGELIRTMTFDEVRDVAGRRLPLRMTLVPSDAPEQRTEVRYDQLELDIPVDPELFTRRGLRRIAR
jgi:outer membrane lipoprotein-sorting protein